MAQHSAVQPQSFRRKRTASGGAVPVAQAATTGSGGSVSETRPVAELASIAVVGSQGETTTLQVQADDNLLQLLETSVESGRLKIGWKRGESVQHRSAVKVTVVTPKLTALSAAGPGEAGSAAGSLNSPRASSSHNRRGECCLNRRAHLAPP